MKKYLLLVCLSLLSVHIGRADDRTMSFNSEVSVLPAPHSAGSGQAGKVVIDGQTDDWDLSAGVWSYNDPTLVDR